MVDLPVSEPKAVHLGALFGDALDWLADVVLGRPLTELEDDLLVFRREVVRYWGRCERPLTLKDLLAMAPAGDRRRAMTNAVLERLTAGGRWLRTQDRLLRCTETDGVTLGQILRAIDEALGDSVPPRLRLLQHKLRNA